MGHPGFGFERRSFHTVSLLQCPRKAYLSQMLGLRVKPDPTGEHGALAVGKIYHTLLELFLQQERYRGQPLQGTDGTPVLSTPDEVCVWYAERGIAEVAVTEARVLYDRYVYVRGDDADLRGSLIGRPEPDVRADLRHYGVDSPVPVRYAAQYDAVGHAVPDQRGGGVISVEHKSLKGFHPGTIAHYRQSGQVLGQLAVWNARPDLVARFGPMHEVLLNLVFKGRAPKVAAHRERLAIRQTRIVDYARTVGEVLKGLDSRLIQYENATSARERAQLWDPRGPVGNLCAPYVGRPCQFLDVCEMGVVPGELYQITEPGLERGLRDGIVKIRPDVETYDLARAWSNEKGGDGDE